MHAKDDRVLQALHFQDFFVVRALRALETYVHQLQKIFAIHSVIMLIWAIGLPSQHIIIIRHWHLRWWSRNCCTGTAIVSGDFWQGCTCQLHAGFT